MKSTVYHSASGEFHVVLYTCVCIYRFPVDAEEFEHDGPLTPNQRKKEDHHDIILSSMFHLSGAHAIWDPC